MPASLLKAQLSPKPHRHTVVAHLADWRDTRGYARARALGANAPLAAMKWPIKPSSQTTIDLFTRRNLKPTPKPKRNTLIQALPDLRPLEISVRDRLYTRCEWGQNWGQKFDFSSYNYRFRAKSKCFLGIRMASKALLGRLFS